MLENLSEPGSEGCGGLCGEVSWLSGVICSCRGWTLQVLLSKPHAQRWCPGRLVPLSPSCSPPLVPTANTGSQATLMK